MKPPNLSRWKDPVRDSLLVLFAQRIEEALFDYTLDSYKARTLNTHSRCLELHHVITEVRAGRMPEKTLEPLYEELTHSLVSDAVAQQLLGPFADTLKQIGAWARRPLQDVRAQVDVIFAHLGERRYETAILDTLAAQLASGGSPESVVELANDLAVEWQNLGFSRDFVYYKTRAYFFSRKGPPIEALPALDEYRKLFTRRASEYRVILRASKDFLLVADKLPMEAAAISAIPPESLGIKEEEKGFLNEAQDAAFVTITIPKAKDARSAADIAEALLAVGADIARLHAHRLDFRWDPDVLVYNADGYPRVLRSPTSAVHKLEDPAQELVPDRVAATLGVIYNQATTEDTRRRFQAALSLHSTALTTKAVDTQLFSLWSALESLLPLDGSPSRIARTCETLVPVLARDYPLKLINDFRLSLKRCNPGVHDKALSSGPKDRPNEAIARMIVLEGGTALREAVYKDTGRNPLLAFRLQSLNRSLKNPDTIRRTIEAHQRRLDWHLRRIYRNRNLLAHRGETLPYRAALVENLHSYLDTTLLALQRVFAAQPRPRSLNAAFVSLALEYRAHLDLLGRLRKEECTEANLSQVLFGRGEAAI